MSVTTRELTRTVRSGRDALDPVAPGVTRVPIIFVNCYMVDDGDDWVLVDTGLPLSGGRTIRAAEARYGKGTRPKAIILTHGHFDHAGSALLLSQYWDVPIYAHPLELPFLTGRSDYPPQDPTLGGAISTLSRAFPHHGSDFGDRVRPLPANGDLPALGSWRWLHTPGHTPGHVSLHRPEDDTLLAGDALATMNMDSWSAQVTREPELDRPPAPFTPDWEAAAASVARLAELEPRVIAAGHGVPVTGPGAAGRLRRLADRFPVPDHGRYVPDPAVADERGVVWLPPPVPDPFPRQLATVVAATLAFTWLTRRL